MNIADVSIETECVCVCICVCVYLRVCESSIEPKATELQELYYADIINMHFELYPKQSLIWIIANSFSV